MRGEINQLNKIVVSTSLGFSWAPPFIWYSSSNNLLVRILTLHSILSLAASVCVFMMLLIIIDEWKKVLEFHCMKICRLYADNAIISNNGIVCLIFNCLIHKRNCM